MIRVALLAVLFALGCLAFAAMVATIRVGAWHQLVTWSNTAALVCLAWYCVRLDARLQRQDAYLGTWRTYERDDHE